MSAVIQLPAPQEATHFDGRQGTLDPATGGLWVPDEAGGLELVNDWQSPPKESKSHTGNLVYKLSTMELSQMASDLWRGISADDRSRAEYLDMTAEAISMLGIRLELPGSPGSDAPLDGMSRVRNPLLLDCVIGFQADTMGELLPAAGPAKIRNDGPGELDPLATALEGDFNHYLTAVATEYYPDTDRGIFAIGLIGGIVKKVYRCPTRRRPVSEVVYLQDIIVNASATTSTTLCE